MLKHGERCDGERNLFRIPSTQTGLIRAVLSRLSLLPMVDFRRERVFGVSKSDVPYRRLVKGPDFMAEPPRVKNADYPYHDPRRGLHEIGATRPLAA